MSEQIPQTESPLRKLVIDLLKVETDDPMRRRRGQLVNLVLLLALSITLLWLVVAGTVAAVSMLIEPDEVGFWRLIFLVVVLSTTYAFNRRSASPFAGLVLSFATLMGSITSLLLSGPLSTGVITLTLPVLIAGLLGPPSSAYLLATLGLLAYGVLNVQSDPAYLAGLFRGDAGGGTIIVYLNLYVVATLTWLFSRMAGQAIRHSHAKLQALGRQQQDMEKRLEQQAMRLHAATRVARALSDAREFDVMLADVVRLVREYFGYEFIHIYLLDADQEVAVLHAATGAVGESLLAAGHQFSIHSMSAVGQAAAQCMPIVVDPTHDEFPIQHVQGMPQMRSEAALPLLVGEDTIGVLALQSVEPDTFGPVDLPGLLALADQIAFAIANVRVYEEAQQNLHELSLLGREATHRGWWEYLASKGQEDRVYRRGKAKGWAARQKALVEEVVRVGNVVLSEDSADGRPGYLAVPMLLRGEVIGVIGVESDEVSHWTQDDVRVVQGIAERTSLAVENMRLFEQAQRTASRERLVNDITRNVQRAESVDDVLQVALQELGRAIGASRGVVQLQPSKNANTPSITNKQSGDNGQPVSTDNVASKESRS
jgi:GAF domain-containing protein